MISHTPYHTNFNGSNIQGSSSLVTNSYPCFDVLHKLMYCNLPQLQNINKKTQRYSFAPNKEMKKIYSLSLWYRQINAHMLAQRWCSDFHGVATQTSTNIQQHSHSIHQRTCQCLCTWFPSQVHSFFLIPPPPSPLGPFLPPPGSPPPSQHCNWNYSLDLQNISIFTCLQLSA